MSLHGLEVSILERWQSHQINQYFDYNSNKYQLVSF